MTNSEQKTVTELYNLVANLSKSNEEFRAQITEQVEAATKKVDKKHVPAYLEQDILRAAQESIAEAIQKTLVGYSSPLLKLVESVVNEQSSYLREIISESLAATIQKQEFKNAVNEAFAHKIAKNLVSGADSLFSKTMNELKQDAIFKSKMILAVEKIVDETLKEN